MSFPCSQKSGVKNAGRPNNSNQIAAPNNPHSEKNEFNPHYININDSDINCH